MLHNSKTGLDSLPMSDWYNKRRCLSVCGCHISRQETEIGTWNFGFSFILFLKAVPLFLITVYDMLWFTFFLKTVADVSLISLLCFCFYQNVLLHLNYASAAVHSVCTVAVLFCIRLHIVC